MRIHALIVAAFVCCIANPLAFGQVAWSKSLLKKSDDWFRSAEAKALAECVLKYQSVQGGWPKNTDLAIQPNGPKDIPQPGDGLANTIDNHATTLPLQFLARMVHVTGNKDCAKSFRRGIDYLLAAQYPNGGWPQFWPLRKGYYSRITYNDDAMVHTMSLLREVAEAEFPYGFVSKEQQTGAADAVGRGIECILKTQVIQNGKRTAWCAQHDQQSLEPAWARAYEPPSLSGGESVAIARFLMAIEDPSDEVVDAIQGVVTWLQAVQMKGVRLEQVKRSDGKTERILVADKNGSPLWARFYELETNRPLYLDRDSVFRYDYSKISYERRSGYSYHGTWAASLLEKDYPKWKKKHAADIP